MKPEVQQNDPVLVHWIIGDDALEHSGKGEVAWQTNGHTTVRLVERIESKDPSHPHFEVGHLVAIPHECWHPHPRVELL
jgi:hypothetical protein